MTSLRPGVRIGVDVGRQRVGLAKTDPHGVLASPVATVARDGAISAIRELLDEYEVLEIVVGRPLGLSGHHTPSTDDAEAFARELAGSVTVPVQLLDERLSTVQASAALREQGHSSRTQRQFIDQAAAVIILQHSLESEARSGEAAGQTVPRPEGGQ